MKKEEKRINQDTLLDEKATIIHDKTNEIMAGVIELTGKINSDLTGKFTFKYFRSN